LSFWCRLDGRSSGTTGPTNERESSMKVRIGFVSNSSSSSFLLLTTKENYQRAISESSEFDAEVAQTMVKEVTFLGRTMVYFELWHNQGGSWSEYIDVDGEGSVYEAWEAFERKLKKSPSEVFVSRIETG